MPDAWGRRVIARAHAKERKKNPKLAALTELDHLVAVDDFSRVGALRLQDGTGAFLTTVEEGRLATPPLVELARWHYQKALAAKHPRNPDLEKMLDEKSKAK